MENRTRFAICGVSIQPHVMATNDIVHIMSTKVDKISYLLFGVFLGILFKELFMIIIKMNFFKGDEFLSF